MFAVAATSRSRITAGLVYCAATTSRLARCKEPVFVRVGRAAAPDCSQIRLLHSSVSIFAAAGVRAAQRSRDKPDVLRAAQPVKPVKGDPTFRELWRKFQLKVHPDLFTKFPALKEVNDASLQKLQGILNECKSGEKSTSDYLRPRVETLEFYLRTDKDNAFIKLPLTLRIPGANCRNVLAESFAVLFKQAGLPTRFHWGPEYWQSTYVAPERREGEDDEA